MGAHNGWPGATPLLCGRLIQGTPITDETADGTAFVAGAAAGVVTAFVWNQILGKPLLIEGFVVGVLVNLAIFALMPQPATQRAAA